MVDPLKRKQLKKGLEQLAQEGSDAALPAAGRPRGRRRSSARVGQLQFEVVRYRLESEYGVQVRLESTPYQLARWVARADGRPLELDDLSGAVEGLVLLDIRERLVVLFDRDWALRTAERLHPELAFSETAIGVVVRAA